MWQKCSIGLDALACTGTAQKKKWVDSIQTCNDLTLAARSDWRLPNVHELRSITNLNLPPVNVEDTYFPNTINDRYWTSTTSTSNLTDALDLKIDINTIRGSGKDSATYLRFVRCVTSVAD